MKHLKSTAGDLHHLMDQAITVSFLCEPFLSCEHDRPATEVRPLLEERNFDVVGVSREGRVEGYCWRESLTFGVLADHSRPVEGSTETAILSGTSSLLQALDHLAIKRFLLIATSDQDFGIVTRGDLHKAPIRMWLFGVVTLLEMQLLRVVREHYPNERWRPELAEGRVSKADDVFRDRQRHNEQIDSADCLQFCDKADLICRVSNLRTALGFSSRKQCGDFFSRIQRLRDKLAHAQDISGGDWPSTIALAQRADQLLQAIEVAKGGMI